MDTADFTYHLPEELIAQEPARPRDSSRLLVLHRARGDIEHRQFRDLPRYLTSTDLVVLNDTQVMHARLRGRRQPGGGRAEVLLLEDRGDGLWEALVWPARRLPPGREIAFGQGELRALVVERTPSGGRLLRFIGAGDLRSEIARLGEVPLPPYVHRPLDHEADYQTVYARTPGASAAPTAGLHFSEELLREVRAQVSALAHLTLHVGLGTFRPIHAKDVEDHHMHCERFHIPQETAALASRAVEQGRRVVAVGTSTTRALEAAADAEGRIASGPGETDLFIRPGYRFKVIRALVTNFHMPRSTLLLMVCAFAGRETMLHAYQEAVERRYRFLSFGDAMFIL